MSSSIAELRQLVEDPESDLAGLFSRAVLLSNTLKQKNITAWLKHELAGYSETEKLPDYRLGACGTLVAWFPGQGWAEAPIERANTDEGLLCYSLYQSLPDIETAFNENSRMGGQRVDFTDEKLAKLQEQTRLSTRLALAVPSKSFAFALLGAREALRLWIERLTHLGLPEDAHRFTDEQRQQAAEADAVLAEIIAKATTKAQAEAATFKPKKKGFFGRLLGIGG
ncbi:AbiTii domain-containing protein [Thiosocius teredinicola]|uniref:AbiTii domain-containing protein n=1 Tax=Thiosocius teredinicola TaxID=1973002 RepID=UPI000990FD77